MLGVVGVAVTLRVSVTPGLVPSALEAVNVTGLTATVVGVPVTSPVVVLMLSPAGSPVAWKMEGTPLAVIW